VWNNGTLDASLLCLCPTVYMGIKQRAVIHLSVHLSVCPTSVNNGAFYGCGYYRTLIGNRVLEVKLTGQRCCCMATGSNRNGNEAIAAGPASEAFGRRLHRTVCLRQNGIGGECQFAARCHFTDRKESMQVEPC